MEELLYLGIRLGSHFIKRGSKLIHRVQKTKANQLCLGLVDYPHLVDGLSASQRSKPTELKMSFRMNSGQSRCPVRTVRSTKLKEQQKLGCFRSQRRTIQGTTVDCSQYKFQPRTEPVQLQTRAPKIKIRSNELQKSQNFNRRLTTP